MIDDKTFQKIVLTSGILLLIYMKLENYGYEKAIAQLKTASESLLFVLISVFILYFVLKKVYYVVQERSYRKRYQTEKLPERKKHCTTKKESSKIIKQHKTKELPKNTIIAKPKDEILHELSPKQSWRKVSIKVDDEIKFHKHKDLNKDEVKYLLNKHFKMKTYFNPFTRKKEKFVFKTNGHESDTHFLMICIIVDYLKDKVDDIKSFETVKPDIVFEIKNKKIAIEVETGKVIRLAKKQLIHKVKLLNKDYDNWFFVVTDKNFLPKYQKFGKTFERRNLAKKIDKLLKNL